MATLAQVAAVTALSLRSIGTRLSSSLVIVAGIALVVGVLLSMLSFSSGLQRTLLAAAQPDSAIVVIPNARDENGQGITRDATVAILSAPGVRRDSAGEPVASTENINYLYTTRLRDGMRTFIAVRGITEKGLAFRPGFRLVSGRMFRPGTQEVIAGTTAQAQFGNLEVGGKFSMPGGEWDIVGAFETGGDPVEGQLLGDLETIMASRRQNGFGSLRVQLESPEAFPGFQAAIAENPGLNVDVLRQSEFAERGAGQFAAFFATVAYVLGGILAVGALFGTVNMMQSAVASRAREIATLRALGFGAAAVGVSVVAESLVLALIGAAIGAAAAWLLFNGYEHSVGGFVLFDLAVTPRLIAIGVICAMLIALLGGSIPAVRAARLQAAEALRGS
jgi:putative ABC transport system permease protein